LPARGTDEDRQVGEKPMSGTVGCKHCGQEIEAYTDYQLIRGMWRPVVRWAHPDLIDGALDAGPNRNGIYCAGTDCEVEAEPASQPTNAAAA
jgi:hypothetical protein